MIDLFDRLRRPEYTGENRCFPCTITNGVLLAAVVGALALLGRRLAAGVVAVGGALAIGLRGYVVPYTPRIAPSLVAALPVDPFDHGVPDTAGSLSDSSAGADAMSASPTGDEVLTALLEAGVVVSDGGEIRLDPDVREDWRREMRTLREADLADLARIADRRTEPSVAVRTRRGWNRSVLVLDRGSGALTTLPRGIAVAELAAGRALEPHVESAAIRRAAGRPLRTLLEQCPLCDGELTVSRSSCCGEVTPVGGTPSEKLFCPDCDARFFTFEEPER
ncbi:hypothetical protein RBH26_03775 [Natronolimnohabitans sp. A-GB9]|uniref:hypothetical protein n=1 Tax=Natronolimnohabitans sp. A-GB9 TaxID=3069757 RepID=UPI0027B7A149|nr:hypothetical protein [Natronolimnohabitans sp. A-GB9]MDQ2049595.1 hypothetical protein [Natronolimnohabitans sp. A-GB9]